MSALASLRPLTIEDVRHFTVEEFDRLVETGILTDEERVELLEGMLIPMMPIGDQHAACVKRLNDLLTARLSGRALLGVQDPIGLPTSRPYPDLAVLRRRSDYYATGKPQAPDIFLVIEVADTSLARDRDVKLPAYGRAGIPESWIVDLTGDAVIAGRDPSPTDRKSTRLNSSHSRASRMPSSA